MNKSTAIIILTFAAAVTATAGAWMRSGSHAVRVSGAATAPFETKRAETPATDFKFTAKGAAKAAGKVATRAKAYDVPFIEDFSNAATLADWGIQDVNNDNNSWEYKESFQNVACYFPTSSDANNDWLVTPPINLGKDDVYTLTFSFGSQGTRFAPEHLTVTMGTSEFATQHTTVLFDKADIQNFWNGSMETVTVTLPVEEDGAYTFGFHCSTAGGYALYLDDIKVEQNGSHAAPAPVADLTVTPGAKGALNSEISLTAPKLTADGDALQGLDAIALYRDSQLIHTFATPAPGAALTYTDAEPTNGLHTYKAIASAAGQEGAKAEISVFIGVDTPLKVANLKASETDGNVKLSWDAPLGVNGGYTGPEVVSYTVTRVNGEEETVLDDKCAATTFTDKFADLSSQNHVYYTVAAHTAVGAADAVMSNSLFVGPSYQLPFRENFDYCGLKASPWVMETINSGTFPSKWQLTPMGSDPLCQPVDGDDGMLEFLSKLGSWNFYQGNVIRLATPAIDLSQATAPFVSFYLFHYDTTETSSEYDEDSGETVSTVTTYKDKLHLQIALDNGEYADIPESEIELAANNKGWTLYTFPLTAYKGARKASVALVGTSDGGGNICVDHLTVADKLDRDLTFTGLLGPASVKVGQKAEYVANIVNNGTSSTKDYTIDLYVDKEKVDSQKGQGAAIFANGGEKTVRLSFTPEQRHSGAEHRLYAVINYAADQCQADNTSDAITLNVPGNALPAPAKPEAKVAGNTVTLTWNEPDMSELRLPVMEDIEECEAFTLEAPEGFSLIDNDKASKTYTVSGINSYPNAGGAMAYQVFNPRQAGIDTEDNGNRRWVAHSGSQMLVAWGADVSSGASANDDWLISPELSGEAQRVNFYIKSVSMAYPERFRVLYSTDSRSVSDFVKVAETNYYTPVSYWRRFSVNLPAGAKYFAIQCISADGFGLMVDDLSFTPATSDLMQLDFMGYNVYRDGTKVNATPLGEPTFTDTPGNGSHDYYVTALYASGESSPSPVSTVGGSGIDNVPGAASDFRAIGHTGCLEIDGLYGEVAVYTVDGRLAARETVAGNLTFSIAPGTYVVSGGGKDKKVKKVIVK